MSFKQALRRQINRSRIGALMQGARSLRLSSYLLECGWFASVRQGMPIDVVGKPLPWYTYPAIHFIGERLKPTMMVFEFGSGNSTLWWADRVARVTACEHDRTWYQAMQPRWPLNVSCIFEPSDESGRYADSVCRSGDAFDVIVIDGRQRVLCAARALRAIAPRGVIVWDNSDRSEYAPGFDILADAGFKRIDFWGMGPINTYGWCTSVFYRVDNCFGL